MLEHEEKLFKEWRKKREKFVIDGIVNFKKYSESKIKVLYILKEVNGGGSWNLKKFLNDNGGRFQTWNNIARWQYGIENKEQNVWDRVKNINKDFRKTQLRNIAVINFDPS